MAASESHTDGWAGGRPGGGRLYLSLFVGAALASLVIWLGHLLVGRRLLAALLDLAVDVEGFEDVRRWLVADILARLPDLMLAKLVLLIWILAGLGLLALAARPLLTHRRWLANAALTLITLLVLAYGVESFVAPFLISRVGLENYFVRLAPDHRMPPSEPTIPTNADGIRGHRERAEFGRDHLNVLFLGDSYTYGKGVPVEETFPSKVERILQMEFPQLEPRVANFGWVSASPLLSLRLLREIGADYHPDWIVHCIDMTDLFDDLYYDMLLEGRGIYPWLDKAPLTLELLRRYWPPAFWGLYWRFNAELPRSMFFAVKQPLAESRPHLAAVRRNVERIGRFARDHGARYMVVILPRSFQYSREECPENWERAQYDVLGPHCLEPFRFFGEMKQEVDFPIYSLLEDFRRTDVFPTCFRDDPHWNADGHTVAALGIAKFLYHEITAGGAVGGAAGR